MSGAKLKTTGRVAVMIVVLVAACALVLKKASIGNNGNKTYDADRDTFTSIECVCGDSDRSTAQAYANVRTGDPVALAALTMRAAVITLPAGTSVHQMTTSGGMARVLIRSGIHGGKHCWIPTSLLQ